MKNIYIEREREREREYQISVIFVYKSALKFDCIFSFLTVHGKKKGESSLL